MPRRFQFSLRALLDADLLALVKRCWNHRQFSLRSQLVATGLLCVAIVVGQATTRVIVSARERARQYVAPNNMRQLQVIIHEPSTAPAK